MRDVVAALVAAALIFFALSLLTSLHFYRKRHRLTRDEQTARGRTIIVELPTDPELTLFTEDAEHFHYGATTIAKKDIMAAMRSAKLDSPRGTMTFSKAQNPIQDIYLRQVKNGDNVVLGVAHKALSDPGSGCGMA